MSAIEVFLNTDLGLFALSAIAVPLVILIIGILLYRYKPPCRLANGVALLILGSMGLLLYPIASSLYTSVRLYPVVVMSETVGIVFLVIVFIEIFTFYFGINSIRKRIIPLK